MRRLDRAARTAYHSNRAAASQNADYFGATHQLKEVGHESGTQILLHVKLRTASRQFDAQAVGHVQTANQGNEIDPVERRVFRGDGQRQVDLLEAGNRQVPGRARGDRPSRRLFQENGMRALVGSESLPSLTLRVSVKFDIRSLAYASG